MKFIIALLISCAAVCAELIPADRLTDWTPGVYVGVPGGIDQYTTSRTNIITVTADTTGVVDARPAMQAAINSAPANSVVYLPAGTYSIGGAIGLKSNITFRGAGMDVTIIKPSPGVDPVLSAQNWMGARVAVALRLRRLTLPRHQTDLSAPCATYDAATGTASISVNNGTPATATKTGGSMDTTGTFYIGREDNGDFPSYITGVIDEVGYWNKTLSPTEITTLYNAGAGLAYPF